MGVTSVLAQVAFNTDGSAPDNSAILDVKSTTKGLLLPRMTNNQIELIAIPADGLLVYSTDDSKVYCFNSGDNEWKEIDYGTGTIEPWICGDVLIDTRDAKTYNTVQIGAQCWMAENLNIGSVINSSNNQTDDGLIEKYCYNNTESNCTIYGGLYQWNEMMQYVTTEGVQGICPTSWHLPTDAEWCILENYVDAGTVSCTATGNRGTDVGGNLKETGTTHWSTPNLGATNLSGFTSLPAGYRYMTGSFSSLTTMTFFWSSNGSWGYGTGRRLSYDNAQVYRFNSFDMAYGISVRCIQDTAN